MKYIIYKTLIRMPNTKYFLVQMPSQEKTSSPNSKLKKKITCLHCSLLHMRRDLREITDALGAA